MDYHQRPLSDSSDLAAMQALAQASPNQHLHVIDLPWRLTSWALDDPQNTALWFDSTGRLTAWAVMQKPFWMLDYTCDPAVENQLFPQILAWGDQRAKAALNTPYELPAWYTTAFSTQIHRIAVIESAGFTCQADLGEDSWSQVLLERDASEPVPTYRLPKGITIRPLQGEVEAQAYVDLHRETFGTRNMTLEWRLRTLRHPDHLPDIDLVAADENGRLVAFCICWLNALGGAIEPLGCHSDYRKYALGRTLLCEGLRRLQAHSARTISVHTDDYRDTAYALYEHLGFKVIHNILIFGKNYSSSNQ